MRNIKIMATEFDLVESPKRYENEKNTYANGAEYENICVCCGKGIKDFTKAKSIHMIEGGEYLTEVDEDFGDGDMFWFSIGPACYKKFLKNRKEIESKIKIEK